MEKLIDRKVILEELNSEEGNTLTNTIVQNKIKNDSKEIDNGYGACKSCSCKGWIPNNPKNDYCKNCDHHWERHW